MQQTVTGLWELFLSAFISSTIAPGGSEAVLAYMATTGNYRIENLVFAATLGNTLGAMTTWGLGVLAAKKFPVATLLSADKQQALNVVKTRGQWALFFSWLPVVGDALCFAGGWLKLPLLSAFLIIMLGKFCRYLVIAWLFF
ncbi:YqaA family protein [Methyloglobulus sp.]|uniref:YqaA family protein n=1 Tax=Methyloglobulus sp. TaxID=2518622 RepID=UPI00398A0C5A